MYISSLGRDLATERLASWRNKSLLMVCPKRMNNNNQKHKLLKTWETHLSWIGVDVYNSIPLPPLLMLLFQDRKTTCLVVHKHWHVLLWHRSGIHIGLLQLHGCTLSSCYCELWFFFYFFNWTQCFTSKLNSLRYANLESRARDQGLTWVHSLAEVLSVEY